MVKILVLSFRFPYPLTDGARIRIYHLCRFLSQHHKVDLVSLNEGQLEEGALSAVKPIFKDVMPFPFHPLAFKFNALKGLISRDPLQVHYYYFPKIQRWLNDNWHKYQAIMCFHIRTAKYIELCPEIGQIPRLIDLIDATSLNYQEASGKAKGIWKLVLPIENLRALNYELKTIRMFDKALITSAYDRQYLQERSSEELRKVVVIPNGVREDLLQRPVCDIEEDTLVFLGKMSYAPNIDAVNFFAKEVFPLVRRKLPRAKFIIVGTSPSKEVLALQKYQGIKVTGYVKDAYSYLERAKLVVVPLRFGAGIQYKVLEAMALGKAVVTTPKGVRGIPEAKEGICVIANTPQEMSQWIIELWNNRGLRQEIGENARRVVKEKYRWDVIQNNFLAEVEEVVS